MSHTDPESVTALLIETIRMVGRRAIIQEGWSGLAKCAMPRGVLATGFAPHTWLFPHAACVVHHGGAGTSAAAFRAGVPAVFVPHAADQPLWGQLAHELGLTVEPIHILDLTAEALASAISEILTKPRYKEANVKLSEGVKADQGVRRARELIEQLVYRIGLQEQRKAPAFDLNREDKINRRKQYQQLQRSRKRVS
jgi:UDP:flavonoid glycosyltransferase YjiC (YdhE family)